MSVRDGSIASVAVVLPAPATAAGDAGTHRPIIHIGCPDREVSLCRGRLRLPGEDGPRVKGTYCVVCLDLARRKTCPDCGRPHQIAEAA